MHVQRRGRGSRPWRRCLAGFSQEGEDSAFISEHGSTACRVFCRGTRPYARLSGPEGEGETDKQPTRPAPQAATGVLWAPSRGLFTGALGAKGFLGWGETVPVVAPVAETAFFAMHFWNIGVVPELAFTLEGPAGPVMAMPEWAARSVPLARSVVPGLLAPARSAGVQVIRVAPEFSCAAKYPSYGRTLAIVGREPSEAPAGPRSTPSPTAILRRTDCFSGRILRKERNGRAQSSISPRKQNRWARSTPW